ncbi:hypothetical protein KO561_06320 [Radiobacillus kanasensis]|uniref:hypothetical protein n=1 Tax=Radiobacillus kanasensis TaxID=2844358 RepID=UPI001E33C4CD|nr:hypothetical protein [Radiobacillus kanasensis]UFU00554.1 hypothetical protein KO561_06320 [Radiobacillus kanasensis]
MKERIERLEAENTMLRKQLNEYIYYINHLPAYEYHLGKIKIEKVKGTLQLGELVEENSEQIGIHKIFVKELEIREIEGTGIVGVGVTKKKVTTSKPHIVPPEEATERIKKIYQQIKETLHIQVVPILFQKLAVKENVLEQTWKNIQVNWNHQKGNFQLFSRNMEEHLKKVKETIGMYVSPNMIVRPDIVKKVEDDLEAQIKTDWLLFGLIREIMPGVLGQLDKEDFLLDKLPSQATQELLKKIKDAYQLKHLSDSLNKLDGQIAILETLYSQLLVPLHKYGVDEVLAWDIFKASKQYFFSDFQVEFNLEIQEMAFLFENLMEEIKNIPKYLLLELALVVVAEEKAGGNP